MHLYDILPLIWVQGLPMKSWNQTLAFIASLSFIGGCSIHPTIEDVTNYTAYDIVRKARCEAREVLTAKLKGFLKTQTADPAAVRVAADLEADPDSINHADFRQFAKYTRDIVNRVSNSAIAFDFTLNITENNAASTDINIAKIFPSGTRTLGLAAGSDLTRNNISTFFVTDTFISLLKEIEPPYCYKYDFTSKTSTKLNTKTYDFIYPIAGRIGIEKSIDVFVNMSIFNSIDTKDPNVPPTMSDALEFTTKFTGSANPALTFLPGAPGTRLASAALTASSYREDKHKVIIGLSAPPDNSKAPIATDVFTGQLIAVRRNATPAEVRAANAVSRHILRFEIGQRTPTPVVIQSLFPFF